LEVKTNKLSNLISKSVYQKKDKGKTFLFWLEGFNCDLRKEDGRDQAIITDEILIDKIKSDTRLPIWLDSYIFEDLHAKYEPDFRKFDYNLEHSTYDLLIYLGTYFPRSYAESFCIFDDIFSNETFNKEIRSKDELNILDIGCGTGGNLIGLLTAIKKHFSCVSTINVYAIDGNPDALKILESILNHFSFNYKFKINHTIFAETFKAVDEISETISRIQCESFDFIMSFKTMVEIISKGNGRTNNSYLRWLNLVSDLLISNGLALIADVTTKTDCSDYLPLLLNEQSRIFAKSKPEYKILSPRSCNCYSNLCTNSCFSQHEFSVSHSNKINDVSRIAYKIIGRSNFVDKVLIGRKKGKFIINWKQYNTGLLNGSICINSLGSDIFIDSYKIS
jgi:SAM-dependent methyltransferase